MNCQSGVSSQGAQYVLRAMKNLPVSTFEHDVVVFSIHSHNPAG